MWYSPTAPSPPSCRGIELIADARAVVANGGIVVAVQRDGANMVSVATFALQAEQLRVEGGIPTEATARSRDGHHCLGIDGDLIHVDEVAS